MNRLRGRENNAANQASERRKQNKIGERSEPRAEADSFGSVSSAIFFFGLRLSSRQFSPPQSTRTKGKVLDLDKDFGFI